MTLLVQGAEVEGNTIDVLVADGRVSAVGRHLDPPPHTEVIAAGGGALLPGLHDHHVHLLAMAARPSSLDLGPANIAGPADLDRAMRSEHDRTDDATTWIRAVDHDDSVGGPLDRTRLDHLAPGRPVRVQHRSGAYWVLSSAALRRLPIDDAPGGVERDVDGTPTGRLWRLDRWLRDHVNDPRGIDLATVGRVFAARGVTGVTDATPSTDCADFQTLGAAVTDGRVPLAVTVMSAPSLAAARVPRPLHRGPVKIVIADHELPTLESLTRDIGTAHRSGRSVAIHCVTAVATALALAGWDIVGAATGDRLEHGSVIDLPAASRLAELGITVVTQPTFVHDHGDRYLREVDPEDQTHLYRCASLLDLEVAVGGSSDAPFGDADPWRAIATAAERRTSGGHVLGPTEAITAERALAMYLSRPADPGGRPRRIRVGGAADLCLLAAPLREALTEPAKARVRLTIAGGRVSHRLVD